jgi:hypothetical protein
MFRNKYNYPKRLSILRFLLDAECIRKNPIPFHQKYFDKYRDSFSLKIEDPKYWKNPDEFIPEPFLGEQKKHSL